MMVPGYLKPKRRTMSLHGDERSGTQWDAVGRTGFSSATPRYHTPLPYTSSHGKPWTYQLRLHTSPKTDHHEF